MSDEETVMRCSRAVPYMLSALACAPLLVPSAARAQSVDDPNLHIDTYLSGLSQPTGMRFFAPNQGFVIEKASGQVKLFDASGISSSPVLNLNVQSDSERGLLGIALDPDFKPPTISSICTTARPRRRAIGLGNQLAKYQWNSSTSTLSPPLITRTISSPAGFTNNGPNHDGGPLVFSGGNLYGVTGDLNRNGVEQNNNSASAATANVGGVYRLNTDLTPAAGNPFAGIPGGSFAQWYSYGVRNSFGLAVDPVTHNVWDTENGPNQLRRNQPDQERDERRLEQDPGAGPLDPQNTPADVEHVAGRLLQRP